MMRHHMTSFREVLLEFFRRQEKQAGSITKLAAACGVSRPAMSQTLSGQPGHAVTIDLLADFCANTGTPPHRLLMALLAIANEMETSPYSGAPLLPHVDYEALPGSKSGHSSVDAAIAKKIKPRGRPKKKQP